MTTCRRARRVLVAVFVTLVVICCVSAVDARVSIFWRTSVVSWDSPATQFRDELAVQGIVYVDGARQLREHAGAALAPAGRLRVPPDPAHAEAVALTSRLTRSPPAA
jgi:hypothetical protein